ncbi:unnamed protein product [Arctogadus glacialis]
MQAGGVPFVQSRRPRARNLPQLFALLQQVHSSPPQVPVVKHNTPPSTGQGEVSTETTFQWGDTAHGGQETNNQL